MAVLIVAGAESLWPAPVRAGEPTRTLRLTPTRDHACPAGAQTPGAPRLSIDEILLSTDRRVDLKGIRLPEGWEARSNSEGKTELVVTDPCARPLELALDTKWIGVTASALRTPLLAELDQETAWMAPSGTMAESRIELGAGAPGHSWSKPRWANQRSSLADALVLVEDGPDRGRLLGFGEARDLDPDHALRSATLTLPATLAVPAAYVPKRARLRLGLESAAPARVTIEAMAATASEKRASTSVELEPGKLAWTDLDLENADAAERRLRIRLDSDSHEPIRLVEPALEGQRPVGPSREDQPNVVLVTLDTVRADHLSLYGYERATTPFLVELAPQSLVFENAYSQVPATRPSHFSILSSRYCRDLGLWSNGDPPLPQSELTLAEVLRSAGWKTGAILSARFLGQDGGVGQGFDELGLPDAKSSIRQGGLTTEKAIEFMSRHQGAPFFLWVHYFDAHLPYEPPLAHRGLFWHGPPPENVDIEPDLLVKEGFGTLHAVPNREYMTAMYDASLRYLDDQLRELFAAAQRASRKDGLVFVVAADHGESLGEHGVYFAHDGLHEPNVRVPLLVWAPARATAKRVPDVVENLDIAPTVLDLAGLDPPSSFEGRSLLSPDGHGLAIFEHGGQSFIGMRKGNLKLIDARRFRSDDRFAKGSLRLLHDGPPLELFDVSRDQEESENLIDGRSDEARRLEAELQGWRSSSGPTQRASEPRTVDPEIRDQLRALGYSE